MNKKARKSRRRNKNKGKSQGGGGRAGRSRPVNLVGSSYLDKELVPITYTTTYSALAGTAVAQTVNVNTSSIFGSYPNFTVVISNLWQEYRIQGITLTYYWTYNTAVSGLYIPAVYSAQFRGDTPPAITIAGLTALPWVVIKQAVRTFKMQWKPPVDDPEAWIFRQTSAALPVTGGIVTYIGAAAPTANVSYLVIKVKALVGVRSRKV